MSGSFVEILDQRSKLAPPRIGPLRGVQFLPVIAADVGCNRCSRVDDHLVHHAARLPAGSSKLTERFGRIMISPAGLTLTDIAHITYLRSKWVNLCIDNNHDLGVAKTMGVESTCTPTALAKPP